MLCCVSTPPAIPTSRRRALLRSLGIGAGLLAGAALYLAGGLDTVPAQEVPTVAAGAVSQAKPWNVTVTHAQVRNDGPPKLSQPGNLWFEVFATIEVRADGSDHVVVAGALSVSGIDGLLPKNPEVRLVRDDTYVVHLHPGMPEQVVFRWERSGDAALSTEVEVLIHGKEYRRDVFTGLRQWMDEPTPRAKVGLPVDDRRTHI